MQKSSSKTDQNLEHERLLDDDERMVLSSILIGSEGAGDCAQDQLSAGDFRHSAHREIFNAVSRLRQRSSPLNAVSIAADLESHGTLAEVGTEYLHDLMEYAPHPGHIRYHAERVRDAAIRRAADQWSLKIPGAVADHSRETAEILGDLEQDVHGLIERCVGRSDNVKIKDILVDALSRIGAAAKEGVPSGFKSLDRITHGFQPGHLIVIGARPSVGKTALACNIAVNAARKGRGSLIVSLEQSRLQLAERLMALQSKMDSNVIRTGGVSEGERAMLLDAAVTLSDLNIDIDDVPGSNITQISARARLLKRRHDLSLIIIDYLQLIAPEDRKPNREQEVSAVSRRVATLARQLNVPVILLAQLNRESERDPSKRPRLHHLRESGAIEQDANIVILLHRKVTDDGNEPAPSQATLIVAKNRDGATGEIELSYRPPTLTFAESAGDQPGAPWN